MDAEWLTSAVIDMIKKNKMENKASALVTDTPNIMRAVWGRVQRLYPSIEAVPCVCHVLNLALKVRRSWGDARVGGIQQPSL